VLLGWIPHGVPATHVLCALANAQAVVTGGVIKRYEDRHVDKVSKFRAGRAHPSITINWRSGNIGYEQAAETADDVRPSSLPRPRLVEE